MRTATMIRSIALSAVAASCLSFTPQVTAQETPGFREVKTLSPLDPGWQNTPPSKPAFYPGEHLVFKISGQIDANHRQWEDRVCPWYYFHIKCYMKRQHESKIRSLADVPALFVLEDQAGRPRGGAPQPPATSLISSGDAAFAPGSGDNWTYVVNSPSQATLTLDLALDSSRGNDVLQPIYVRSLIGDVIAGGESMTRNSCDPIQTCSGGSLSIVLDGWDTDARLELVRAYLSTKQSSQNVASSSLLDPRLRKQHPNELAQALLDYCARFAGDGSDARNDILHFAANNVPMSAQMSSTLNRTLALSEIRRGNLDAAMIIIREHIETAHARFEQFQPGDNSGDALVAAVDYAGWLYAAGRAYMKNSEAISSIDVNRAIGVLRAARDILANAVVSRARTAEVRRAEDDLGTVSVTLARLLSVTLTPGDLQEATFVLAQARYFFLAGYPGGIIAQSPDGELFAAIERAEAAVAKGAAEPIKALAIRTGSWRALPAFLASDWTFVDERTHRLAQMTMVDDHISTLPLPAAPATATKVYPRAGGVLWASPDGGMWLAKAGDSAPVTVRAPLTGDQRNVIADNADSTRAAAIAIAPNGSFDVIADVDQSPPAIATGVLAKYAPGGVLAFAAYEKDYYQVAWQNTDGGIDTARLDLRNPAVPVIADGPSCAASNGTALIQATEMLLLKPQDNVLPVALLYSAGVAQLLRFDATGCHPELMPDAVATFIKGGARLWARRDGWLLAKSDQASDQLALIDPANSAQPARLVTLSAPVSLDRGGIQYASQGGWLVAADEVVPRNLGILDINHRDAGRKIVPLGALKGRLTVDRIRPGSERVLAKNLIGVEHPPLGEFSIYDDAGKEVLEALPLPVAVRTDVETVFAAAPANDTLLLLDRLSTGEATAVQRATRSSNKWSLKPSTCKPSPCSATITGSDGTSYPAHWERAAANPGVEARDTLVELAAVPDAPLPVAAGVEYTVPVRVHDIDGGRQITLKVASPAEILGTLRSEDGQLSTLIDRAGKITAIAWEGGAAREIAISAPSSSKYVVRGRTGEGAVVGIPVGGGHVSVVPYTFDGTGSPVQRVCENCLPSQLPLLGPDVRTFAYMPETGVFLIDHASCTEVVGLSFKSDDNKNGLAVRANLLGGSGSFVARAGDTLGMFVVVTNGDYSSDVHELYPGNERNDCAAVQK